MKKPQFVESICVCVCRCLRWWLKRLNPKIQFHLLLCFDQISVFYDMYTHTHWNGEGFYQKSTRGIVFPFLSSLLWYPVIWFYFGIRISVHKDCYNKDEKCRYTHTYVHIQ